METAQASVLRELTDAVSQIRGVVALILFGSIARGDSDEYSDYDVLVVFESKALLWQSWDTLFTKIGSMNINIHAIPETMEELQRANPVFLDRLTKEGRLLFARSPFPAVFNSPRLDPFSVVCYDLSGLSSKQKMRVMYDLYRRRRRGIVAELGGSKLGAGCVLVPRGECPRLVKLLESTGAGVVTTDVFLERRG